MAEPPKFVRLLLLEDDVGRVQNFRSWLPIYAKLVWAPSAGAAIGLIRRDQGHVYGGVLLDHDLGQRALMVEDEVLSGSDMAVALIDQFSMSGSCSTSRDVLDL